VDDRSLLPLDHRTIDEEVGRLSAGTYALGFVVDGAFVPFLVGRSDSDVNGRLHEWVGVDGRCVRFAPVARASYGSRRGRFSPLGSPALAPVGIRVDATYTHFEFGYSPSAEAAFLTECNRYHELGGISGLDNERHPAPPRGATCTCPAHFHPQG
jgi:hypothetical protein